MNYDIRTNSADIDKVELIKVMIDRDVKSLSLTVDRGKNKEFLDARLVIEKVRKRKKNDSRDSIPSEPKTNENLADNTFIAKKHTNARRTNREYIRTLEITGDQE